MRFAPPVPILRSFDETKTKEFYCDFLGGTLDWEHRFEPGTPLYMQISLGECRLHISEHFGDGCPGARLRIAVDDVDAFQKALLAKKYRHSRPGLQDMPWGAREMTIDDPSGNKITFFTPIPGAA
jgi:uncharacterized glyoxalase superfamily protein PhnB